MTEPETPSHKGVSGRDALSAEEQDARRRAIAELMPRTPYLAWLGVVFESYQPDSVTMRLPFRHELTNDGSVYHGGVVAAALDTAGAAAAWSNHDFTNGTRASTVSMSVQYVSAAKRSDLICRARAVRRAKELIFTEITAFDDQQKVIAHALQTYRIA